MEKEYLVTLHKNCDHDEFWHEMESDTTAHDCGCIPDRTIDCCNRKPASIRTTGYMLNDSEAQELRKDPRVMGVEIEPGNELKSIFASQSGNYSRATSKSGSFVNWGLRRCSISGVELPSGNVFPHNLDGTGVDIVIQDDGVMRGHPEWQDRNGISRLVEHDWYAVTGTPGTMPSGHYGDVGAHGTHVAGIAAGKTYGWAKEAAIYSIRFDLMPTGDEMDLIRLWHQQKTNGRPTIVNASWGYRWYYPGLNSQDGTTTEINYRGVNVGTVRSTNYGNVNSAHNISGIIAVDAALEDLTDAGVIFVKAAGNYKHKQDVLGGADYDNYYKCSTSWGLGAVAIGDPIYYHRPGSPISNDSIVVANVSNVTPGSSQEQLASNSEKGPRIDICAPGSQITSATNSTGFGYLYDNDYPSDSNFNISRISGTSMASPQVCGILACFLQINPTATAQQCKDWLNANSQAIMRVGTGTGDDYADSNSLQGAPNRFAFQPFNADTVITIE